MEMGFTTAVYVVRLFFSFCPLGACRAKKAPNGPFGMALSAWRWR